MASNGKLVRVAVFIDGGYFDEVSRYYKFGHDRGSRLSLEGTNAFIRRITAEKEQVDEAACSGHRVPLLSWALLGQRCRSRWQAA